MSATWVGKRATHLIEAAALLLILALAAWLRLANIRDNPGWYTDEGAHLDIAQHLLRGETRYLAVTQSTLLFAKLPLFDGLLTGLLALGGEPMTTLRAFTAICGVASVGWLYLAVRRLSREAALSLLAALLLAIYPSAVLYSRFGFSYNWLTPLVLLMTLGLGEYLETAQRKWLALAALALGIGLASDLWMGVCLAPLILVGASRRWRDLLWSVPLALLPFGLYAAWMLSTAPQAFLFDAQYTLFRLNTLSLTQQALTLADNYATLMTQEPWFAVGLIGLFLVRPARLQRLAGFLLFLPLLQLGRTVALYSLSFYYLIPLLPFVALGVAALVRYGAPHVWRALRAGVPTGGNLAAIGAVVGAGLLVVTPLAMSLKWTGEQAQAGFVTAIDPFLINPPEARAVAEFVNRQAGDHDLVIASPAVAWLLHARAADFQMAVAAAGQATPHLPAHLPPDRFAFDPRAAQARFVIVDNLWRNWAVVNIPAMAELVREVEGWPRVFQSGEIEVYQNPRAP